MVSGGRYVFSKRSLDNLAGVHPDLVKVMCRALELSQVDFVVTEGVRDVETQRKYVTEGKSRTMNSKHLPNERNGFGYAVDVAAWVNGTVSWDWGYYEQIYEAVRRAASEYGVSVTWGGSWVSFRDGVHFQLEDDT